MPPKRKKETVVTPTASIETGMLELFANPERMGTTHEASTFDVRSDASEHSVAASRAAGYEEDSVVDAPEPEARAAPADTPAAPPAAPPAGVKSESDEKAARKRDAYVKLRRLQSAGNALTRDFVPDDELEVMEEEVLLQEAVMRERQREQRKKDGVRFSRRMLLAFTSFTEFMNKRYDPFDIDIEGWSDSVMENIADYDRPFERLLEKYQGRAEMTPEMELLATLGSSMFMFHLSKSLAAKMSAPAAVAPQPRRARRAPPQEIAVSDASSDAE